MASKILVLNSGSSSLKYKLYERAAQALSAVASGVVERIGDTANSQFISHEAGSNATVKAEVADHASALKVVLSHIRQSVSQHIEKEVQACGHRVVHGKDIPRALLVSPEVERQIEDAASLAPLHNPPNLEGIRAAARIFVGKPQVAVFDTAFHQTMEPRAYLYALPWELYKEKGLRRYGAHGTSYRYLVGEAARMLGQSASSLNLIIAHVLQSGPASHPLIRSGQSFMRLHLTELDQPADAGASLAAISGGAGASMAAIKGGRTVDTSMGLTPLEGLMMGTRCGDLDPAAVIFMGRKLGMSFHEIDDLLNKKSGFVGLSGETDLRVVLQRREQGDERAAAAYEVFIHRLRKYIGAYLLQLGNVDAIVWSAGIGENSAAVRRDALADLQGFGIEVDEGMNEACVGMAETISSQTSLVQVLVIPTDEELSIAQQTVEVLEEGQM